MVSVNNKKPTYIKVDDKLSNNQGKSIDPSEIVDCLNDFTFVESIAVRRSSPSSPLRIYLLIKESNQGGKRLLGRLIHQKMDQKRINYSGSIEIYGMPIFPSLNESSSSFDWNLIDQLQSIRLTNEVSSKESLSRIEKDIIEAWSKYLHIPSDCINLLDNLFELGGNLFIAGRIGHYLWGKDYPITIEAIVNNPTVKGLAIAIETCLNSSSEKPDFLQQINRIDCGSSDRRSLLSWTQRWVFIHEQILGEGHYYYLDVSYPIGQDKDYANIETILNQLVDSVELLRSFIRTRGSSHYLTIAQTRKLSIPVIKVANDSEAREAIDKKKETLNIITGDETFLFDVIFIETPEVKCFTLLIHHLIVDDWSYLLLEEKLFQLLQSNGREGGTQSTSSRPIEYVDYTVWITREFQRKTEIIDPLEEYWLNRLKDLPDCLIPVNFDENNLPKEPKVSGKHVLISLTDEETNGAISLIRSVGTTLDVLAEAVVKVALYKLTGVHDTIIKRIISARLHPASYEMIGHFNNMIYSRTTINPNDTFKAVLRDFHSSWLKDFDNRGHPWINIVAQTNVEHCTPAGISVIGLPEQRLVDDDALPIKIFKVDQFTQVSFELVTCIYGLHEGKLHYCLNYNADLLDPLVIETLVSTFEIFLRRVVTYSDRRIDEYYSIEPVHQIIQWPQESSKKSISRD